MALVTYLVQKTNVGPILNDVTQVFIALDDAVVTTPVLVRQATVNALRARGMTLPDGYFDQSTTVASKFNNVGDLFVIGQSGLILLDFDNTGAPAATGTRVTNLVQRTSLATVLNNVTQVFIAVDNAVATTPALVRQTAVTALRAQGLALPDGYFDQATAISLKFNDVGDLFVVGQSGLVLFDFDASSTPPVVATNGGVVEADLGATYSYTFTPATFTGTTPIAVTPIFTVEGADATGSLISNVFTYTKDASTHALSIRWSATNAFGGPVLSTPITRTIPALSVSDVAPSITTPASVASVDGGATVTYTFTPPVVAGNPTPTVTRVLTLAGVNVTGAMSGNTYVATKTGVTQALVITYTASNGVGSNATSTASATVPASVSVAPLFDFALYNEAGETNFTSVPNLRVSLNGGTTWQTLSAAGLTVSVDDSDGLLVAGFADAAARNAALFHFEQKIPGETNNSAGNTTTGIPGLFFRRVGGPAPVNTALPGMSVSATHATAPIGVA